MLTTSTFANRLKTAMEERNIKALEIAKISNISKANLSSYLSGRYEPKQKNIYLIARCLNVNEACLLGYDCPMEKYDPTIGALKAKLFSEIDNMSEEQLNKTIKFIEDYILK